MLKWSACTVGVIILTAVAGIKLLTRYLYLYNTTVPTFRDYFRRIGIRPRADRSQLIGFSSVRAVQIRSWGNVIICIIITITIIIIIISSSSSSSSSIKINFHVFMFSRSFYVFVTVIWKFLKEERQITPQMGDHPA